MSTTPTEVQNLKMDALDMRRHLARHEKNGRYLLALNLREQIAHHKARIAEIEAAKQVEYEAAEQHEPEEAAWRRAAEENGYHPFY